MSSSPGRKRVKRKKVTTARLREMKEAGEHIAALTAYDQTMAQLLDGAGIDVILVDSNRAAVRAANMDGARAKRGSILSSSFLEGLELGGTGRFIGLTANDEVNALAAAHFSSLYGRAAVYQAATAEGPQAATT